MSNVLIINLRRSGDAFMSSHLIKSIKNNENSDIHYLCYNESARAVRSLKGIEKVHTIDRNKILKIRNNKIYNDAFALKDFLASIEELQSLEWDNVINYSNDHVASYLISWLSPKNYAGVKINQHGLTETNNLSATIFNEVISRNENQPIHFKEMYSAICEIENLTSTPLNLTNSTKYNEVAAQNFRKIRSRNKENEFENYVVGIQLKASNRHKEIELKEMTELIAKIKGHQGLIPVLLIAPIQSERDLAVEINDHFDNSLSYIEFDFNAATSVLTNIDLVITPDTSIKHLADICHTPVLEVSQGNAPFYKQGSVNPESYILTRKIESRIYDLNELNEISYIEKIDSDSIFSAALFSLGLVNKDNLNLNNDLTLYGVKKDKYGIYYHRLFGHDNEVHEINMKLSRAYLQSLMYGDFDFSLLHKITEEYKAKTVKGVIDIERVTLTNIVKSILETLRIIKEIRSDQNPSSQKMNRFVKSFDGLLQYSEEGYISSIPVQIAKFTIENLNSTSWKENLKEVEIELFLLKARLQELNNVLTETISLTENNQIQENIEKVFNLSR